MLVLNMPQKMGIPFSNKTALVTHKRVEADLNPGGIYLGFFAVYFLLMTIQVTPTIIVCI